MLIATAATVAAAEPAVNFARDVQPILSNNCFACHGPDEGKRQADLRLDSLDPKFGPLAPRDGYSVIAPGNVDDSVLISRITSDDADVRMPPPDSNKHLTAEQIKTLEQWIAQGAPWGKHWSFEKPVRTDAPPVASGEWPRNDIDRLILARLEKEKIAPSPPAPRETLLRRAALDLIGLPPTPAEIDAFVADTSPGAYEKQVDRLLASPHFGERQARHWLDAARYADSNGYSHDFPRSIWPYRDYVINAMNADMPFDRFTTEQIAGDMLPDATLEQKIATGFHRNTQINTEGGIDPEQFRVEAVVDRVATTATVFLGMTMACAQCHTHKFDPISHKEYYQFFAFFNNADEPTLKVSGVTDPREMESLKERVAQLDAAVKQRVESWEASLTDEQRAKLKPNVREALSVPADKRDAKQQLAVQAGLRSVDNDFGAMSDEVEDLRKQLSDGNTTLVLAERPKDPRKTTILVKGDFTRPSDEVTPAVPAVLHPLRGQELSGSAAGQPPTRLDLASWLTDPANPLTARVTVNRIWQQYFGQGIVETENDFGSQGTAPTHPELLDYLATELISNNWSLKHIHKLIVTSATYQQSSNARPDLAIADPYNKLLARQSRVRLEAEIVRDVALASSGLLAKKIGGPSVFPPIPDGVMGLGQVKHAWKTSTGEDRFRRGMYTFTFRNSLHPALATFDAPDASAACTRRIRSNTPLQALNLLNDAAWIEFSRGLAKRTLNETSGQTDDRKLAHVFRLATSRAPAPDEIDILAKLLNKLRADLKKGGEQPNELVADQTPAGTTKGEFAAWTLVARAVLNLDETITRE